MFFTADSEDDDDERDGHDDDAQDDDDSYGTEARRHVYLVLDPLPECGVYGLRVVGDRGEGRGHGGLVAFSDRLQDGIAGLLIAAGVFTLVD